jgi:hypothetical protein
MDDYESLSHTKWDCKYHVVFIPSAATTMNAVCCKRCAMAVSSPWVSF